MLMQLPLHSPRRRQSGAADWLRYVLVLLIAVLALDLTRRFVKLFQRSQQPPPPAAAQPVEPEPTNAVVYLPPARAEPLPQMRLKPAPAPAADQPEPSEAPPAVMATPVTNPPPRAGRTFAPGVASGRVQADYLLPRGQGLPITIFQPGAVTPIALPVDDDSP
jgi:hypothetical protein